jgi:two-component system, response regulator PdtaR
MRRLKIVVADDEAIIRMGLSSMLVALGHEALQAPNGREALNLIRTTHPDLALLDIQMPLTDGLEAAKVIARSHPMPVIILTAYSQSDLLERAAALPIQGYLVKPVTERDLAAAIEVAMARFEDAQAREKEIAELRDSLETRKLVDRAKGRLMQTGLSEEDAYLALQRRARESRITLKQAAEAVLGQVEKKK